MYKQKIKEWIVLAISFLSTIWLAYISYWAYQTMTTVSSWSILKSADWNILVGNIEDLKTKVSNESFRILKTSDQILDNTRNKITWNSKNFDTTWWFDLINNQFKPTKSWKYFTSCFIYWTNLNSSAIEILLYKNWVQYTYNVVRYNWTTTWINTSWIIEMNWTSDYIDCRVADVADISWNSTWWYFEWYYIWE